jgi:peptidoglycan/xylan/chitin deacetylase (PgdA/CDA1 family)
MEPESTTAAEVPRHPSGWARRLGMVLLVALLLGPALLAYLHYSTRMFVFEGLSGPESESIVPPSRAADWRDFRRGGRSRLAVLLTDEEAPWLGLAHGLRALGVPFTITRDAEEALRHRVVLAYPYISGRNLKPEELRALAAHPRRGGTLIAANVLGGGLNEVFGFEEAVASRDRFGMSFEADAAGWLGLTEPEETSIRLGDPKRGAAQLGTHGYTRAREVLARFDDGMAAITRRRLDGGSAYALGFDPGALLLAGQNARASDLERAYVNAYVPQADTVLRFLRRVWQEGEPLAVTLGRVPDGKPLAAILTFDVDYTRSLPNAVAYAELLRSHGVRGTFFVQTKYMRDYNDAIMLTDETAAHLRRLRELGMEIASHSVAHARAFVSFPMGSGTERYPDYQPFVQAREEAVGGTILGELRVSKFLLERLAAPTEVVSFRPGHLANPSGLPQALAAAGYRFSSSVTAGVSLTHLPFRLNHDRGPAAESATFEFPITIEDEHLPLMGLRLKPSLEIARKIARDGGPFVVLTHPNILDHKLEFNRGILDALKGRAWFGSLADFGAWWSARDGVELNAERREGSMIIQLTAPRPIEGLTVEVPPGWRLDPTVSPGVAARQDGQRIMIGRLEGAAELVMTRLD